MKRTQTAKMFRYLLFAIVITLCSSSACAQEIRIRLLNGRNGHPMSDCLNVWTAPGQRNPTIVRTGKDGVAVIRTGNADRNTVVAPCKYVPTSASVEHLGAIGIWLDLDVDCRAKTDVGSSPSKTKFYALEDIIKTGVASSNTCGKFIMNPSPGELVIYGRRPHWWEAISR